MRTSIFLVVGLFVVATVASAAMFSDSVTATADPGDPLPGSGTYNFYYYGDTQWYWTIPGGGFTGVNFDPNDNAGDTTSDAYEVAYVDSFWNFAEEGAYETTLYICPDDGGVPDFDNPYYTYGPFEPVYFTSQDSQEITPPVPFGAGAICWVLFSIEPSVGHPISDGDGNSGHSWLSEDGYSWELMESPEQVDWAVDVYADDTDDTFVDTSSYGGIKALYQ